MSYRKILCPVDFSEPSRQAMHAAMELASEPGVQVTLVNVYEVPTRPFDAFVSPSDIEAIASASRQALAEWAREARGKGAAEVETVAASGVAWDRIVNLARDGGFDLVVIGTHGRTGLAHALLGSVAERVVRHAPCPVLVARSKTGS
jgi:nucleotide-binding universal stress UspA family protein